MTHNEQLREQITNTLIANECALDHVTGGAPAAKEILIPGTERVMYIGRRADVERLLATTAGEQAECEWPTCECALDPKNCKVSAAPASPEQVQAPMVEKVRAAMIRAYNLGQTYWQQADSEYASEHKKADITSGRFIELTNEICAKLAAPSAAAPAAPTLTDEEITDAVFGIYLSDFDDAKKYDIAIVRAALAALAEKDPAALAADELRNQVLEDAAVACEQIGTDWLDADDAHKNFAADYLATTIRAMKRAVSTEGDAA